VTVLLHSPTCVRYRMSESCFLQGNTASERKIVMMKNDVPHPSADATDIQCSMPTAPYIKPIEQRIELSPAHRHRHARCGRRPHELLLLYAFAPQTQPVARPVNDAHAILPAIGKHLQRRFEHTPTQTLLDQQRKAGHPFAPVHRRDAQIHRHIRPRAHHVGHSSAPRTSLRC